jgi:hypothetical protein
VISLPRRSVTRFFIPLIDVLILLFCIFLLMPFVSGPTTPEPDTTPKKDVQPPLPDNVRDLQIQLTEARNRIERMQKASQANLADRLSVRVLQIDRKDGTLYYFDPDRQEIRTEADALRLIERQKALAGAAGGVKDVLFLILYPQEASGFPTRKQEEQINHWFRDVPHKFQ